MVTKILSGTSLGQILLPFLHVTVNLPASAGDTVQFPGWEDSTCCGGAAKPVHAKTTEARVPLNLLPSMRAATTMRNLCPATREQLAHHN